MPGIKIKIDVDQARVATERLTKELTALGAQTKLTEKETQALEKRLLNKMGADGAKDAVERLSKSIGMTAAETVKFRQRLGEQVGVVDKVKASFATLKQHWIGITGGMIGAAMGLKKVVDYLDIGAQAMRAEDTFKRLTKTMGIKGEELAVKLKAAVRGTIDESDLMQRAVFALNQEIDPNKLPELFQAATVAARTTGRDTGEALEGIVQAISTDMPKHLKQMGLLTKEQMSIFNRAFALGIDDVKMLDIVLAQAAVTTARLGDAQDDAKTKMAQFRAAIHELKETAGKSGWEVLETLEKLLLRIGANFKYAGTQSTIFLAKIFQAEANAEKDPERKKRLQANVDRMGAEIRAEQYQAYSWDAIGKGEPLPSPAYKTGAVPFGKPIYKISPETRTALAEGERERVEKETRDLINEGAKKKQYAENLKAQNAATQQSLDFRYKAEAQLMGAITGLQIASEEKALEGKIALNNKYEKDRKAEIEAEVQARLVSDKLFKDWADDYRQGQLATLGIEMAARREEEKTTREIIKQTAAVELTTSNYDRKVKASQAMVANLQSVYNWEAKMAYQDVEHERKMLTLGVQAAGGELTTNAEKDLDIQAEQNKLLIQRDHMTKDLAAEKMKIASTEDEYFDGLAKQAEMEREIRGLNIQINNLGKERVETMKAETKELVKQHEERMFQLGQRYGVTGGAEATARPYDERITRLEKGKEKLTDPEQIRAVEGEIARLKEEKTLAMKEWTGSWGEGAVTGLKLYTKSLGSEFQIWEQMSQDSAKALQSTFSDFFFDTLTGECKSFSDYWKSFTNGLARSLSDALSKQLISGLLGGLLGSLSETGGGLLGNLGSLFMSSGAWGAAHEGKGPYESLKDFRRVPVSLFASAPSFHEGRILKPGEMPAIIKQEESVLTPAQLKAVAGETVITVPINIEGPTTKKLIADLRREIETTALRVIKRNS